MMDEREDTDATVSSAVASVSEQVVVEKETLAGVQAQIEGSYAGETLALEEEEEGADHGEDIMVEVLGQEVFVDGVCSHSDGSEETQPSQEGHSFDGSIKMGLGKDANFLESGSVAVRDLGSQGFNVPSGGAVLGERSEGDLVRENVTADVREEVVEGGGMEKPVKRGKEVSGGGSNVIDGGSTLGVVSNADARNEVNVSEVAGQMNQLDSRGKDVDTSDDVARGAKEEGQKVVKIDTSADVVSQNAGASDSETGEPGNVNGMKGLEGNLVRKGSEQAKGSVGFQSDEHDSLKADNLSNEAQSPGIKKEGAFSSVTLQDVNAQTHLVAENSVVAEDHTSVDNACTAVVADRSRAEACSGTKTDGDDDKNMEGDGDENMEASAEQNEVAVAAEIGGMAEDLYSKPEGHEVNDFVENSNKLGKEHLSVSGTVEVDGHGHKDTSIAQDQAGPNSRVVQQMDVDEYNNGVDQASCLPPGKINVQDKQEVQRDGKSHESLPNDANILCQSSGEIFGADIVPFREKFLNIPSVEVLNPVNVDRKVSCSENDHIRAEMGSEGKGTSTQELDGEVAFMDADSESKIDPDAPGPVVKVQLWNFEESLDKSTIGHVAQCVSSSQVVNTEEQTAEDKAVAFSGGEVAQSNEHVLNSMVEESSNQGSGNADSKPPLQQTHVNGGEVEAGDEKVLSDDVDAHLSVGVDEMGLCFENDNKLSNEMVNGSTGAEITAATKEGITLIDVYNVSDSAVNVLGPGVNQQSISEGCANDNMGYGHAQIDSIMRQGVAGEEEFKNAGQVGLDEREEKEVDIEGQATDTERVGLHEGQDMEIDEQATDAVGEENVRLVPLKPGSWVRVHQACYLLPHENEGEFSMTDLVWGKIRSHPWWPGQIFYPSDSSEKAMKYYKKDCFLVAYFGDRTFAWNEASQLKPFCRHFSHIEKLSSSESFQNAVDCALEEVLRRVELGLACPCVPKDAYEKIRHQIVENTGIREESSKRDSVDAPVSADSFEPRNLFDYVRTLARLASGGADRLELVIAKAQLQSFYRLRGYCELPEFQFCGGLLETEADSLCPQGMQFSEGDGDLVSNSKNDKISGLDTGKSQRGSYHRRKHNLKEGLYHSKRERSMSELMGDSIGFPDDDVLPEMKAGCKSVMTYSSKKRKAADSLGDDPDMLNGRKTISLAKVSQTVTPSTKPSFNVGNRFLRVASQMTGSPILKCTGERSQKLDGSTDEPSGDGSDVLSQNTEEVHGERVMDPGEYSSLDDLLSQLHLAAEDPLKTYNFSNVIVSFFSDFRNSIVSSQYSTTEKSVGKRKKSYFAVGGPETFEFEDMNDSYWTDRVIENGSEEQPSRRKRKRDNQFVPVELKKPLQTGRRSNSRKQCSDGAHDVAAAEKKPNQIDLRKQDLTPTELMIFFPEADYIPSEADLNKMFRRFGPLWESETEVDRETSRARVIFKRCSDCQVAFGSAGRFNIFGSVAVNYQLNETPTVPFKAFSFVTNEGGQDDYSLEVSGGADTGV